MRKGILGLVLAAFFVVFSTSSVLAQSTYLAKDQAVAKLTKELISLKQGLNGKKATFEQDLKYAFMNDVRHLLKFNKGQEQAITETHNAFSQKLNNNKMGNNISTLNRIRDEVKTLISK